MLARLRRWIDGAIVLSAIVGALALILEVCIILFDVTGRALGQPLYGSQDLVTMVMIIIVFGGIALCDRRDGHIVVDILEPYFPGAMNRIIDMMSAALGALIFVFIAWTVWESAKLSEMLNLSTNLLRPPKAWFQWAICGFSMLTALSMALRVGEIALRRNVPSIDDAARHGRAA